MDAEKPGAGARTHRVGLGIRLLLYVLNPAFWLKFKKETHVSYPRYTLQSLRTGRDELCKYRIFIFPLSNPVPTALVAKTN
jgi:hypothetical protein